MKVIQFGTFRQWEHDGRARTHFAVKPIAGRRSSIRREGRRSFNALLYVSFLGSNTGETDDHDDDDVDDDDDDNDGKKHRNKVVLTNVDDGEDGGKPIPLVLMNNSSATCSQNFSIGAGSSSCCCALKSFVCHSRNVQSYGFRGERGTFKSVSSVRPLPERAVSPQTNV